MSRNIWTRCGARSSLRALTVAAWRVVESQHRTATLKLVDTLAEQELLEELIETHKPPEPSGAEFVGLHYLLAAPFRYPPLRHGSRFGTRLERGIWYGAVEDRTALAEVAYYRLLFLEGTRAEIEHVATEHSAFRVPIRTRAGVDLTAGRFRPFVGALTSPASYSATQPLGTAMRQHGVEAFRFVSARDPERGHGVGVFTPRAFAAKSPSPRALATWHCSTTRAQVVFRRRDLLHDRSLVFSRDDFTVGGALPRPAI